MNFKNVTVLKRAHRVGWHPILLEVYLFLEYDFTEYAEGELLLTSTWRPAPIHPKDSRMHMTEPLRAFDIRSRHIEHPVALRNRINKRWTYDPFRSKYRVAMYHNTGQGWHFHVQVHDRTVKT